MQAGTAQPAASAGGQPVPDSKRFDKEYKIIIIGDAGAGKSSLFHYFREGKFKEQSMSTIGVEFGTKIITLQNEHRRVKLNVWDTAGQERYRAVTRAYYRGAMGAVILFDITAADSFHHVPEWLQDAREQAAGDIDIILVGNKCDLNDRRQVKFMDATTWSRNHGIFFLETSARTGDNIQEVFQILAQSIQARMDKAEDVQVAEEPKVLSPQQQRTSTRSCCS